MIAFSEVKKVHLDFGFNNHRCLLEGKISCGPEQIKFSDDCNGHSSKKVEMFGKAAEYLISKLLKDVQLTGTRIQRETVDCSPAKGKP